MRARDHAGDRLDAGFRVSAAPDSARSLLITRAATVVSIALAAPFVVLLVLVRIDYQPPFAALLTEPDGLRSRRPAR